MPEDPHTGSRETGKPQNVTVLRRKAFSTGKGSQENWRMGYKYKFKSISYLDTSKGNLS